MTRLSESYATTQDMAAKYRIADDTVRRKANSGEWPCDRIGRLYRFSPEQQEEIALIVSGDKDGGFDKNRIAAALNALSA
ncbi:hypothetical protein [Glutamicibacter nicotianae]|uniref:hypothetical protein n=1 Tax=Glutamicibacter nicotianae TaxID=37929 RepID=UPI0025569AFF|nr:hypothetical protein [Glutamicibacter nicotianae]WIV44503.1 hypothetical protein QQS42_02465 [Glutamicibacter nicotianae]